LWYSDSGNNRAYGEPRETLVEAPPAQVAPLSALPEDRLKGRGKPSGSVMEGRRVSELMEGEMGVEFVFPRCRKCGAGDLVPLSDFGSQGASIQFKAWVCTNPNCLFNVKIRNGDIIINEPVSDGSMHSYRGSR
jgi:hypothetical protein